MRKNSHIKVVIMLLVMLLTACTNNDAHEVNGKVNEVQESNVQESQEVGQIYLYGEIHDKPAIKNKEFELWKDYYDNHGMRHLFLEISYFTAEFLNIWMQEEDDSIFTETMIAKYSTEEKIEFFRRIKSECPETIFHGTDVGHRYDPYGIRFRNYLEENNMKESEMYLLTQEAIYQGKHYYSGRDGEYRENKMTENFIREFDKLSGESIMGIYGLAHTDLNSLAWKSNSVDCMATQLSKKYGDIVHSVDLSYLAFITEPIRVDTLKVGEKEYTASYFGKIDMANSSSEYWRLENAYDDFKDNAPTDVVLHFANYPMLIEVGQVLVIEHTATDGSVTRRYYRTDGDMQYGWPLTTEFKIK